MLAITVGVILLMISLWVLIYLVIRTVKNKGNIHSTLLVVPPQKYQEKYEVINIEKFNRIRILQICIGIISGICMGIIAILTKNLMIDVYMALILSCMNLVFISKRNKYVKRI